MRWNIDDVPIYVAIVEHKSISEAARVMGLSKSTVSKALTRLEDALGVRLIERNSRNLRITSEGEIFQRHASLIMAQVQEADAVMAGMTSEPFGKLVVALPMAFAREFVAPNLKDFHAHYPQVDIEMVITSHPVDILRDQIDLAVMVGALNDSELVARQLYESTLMWVTSPAYAEVNQLTNYQDDILPHVFICEKRYGVSNFPIRVNGVKQPINLEKGLTHVNDPLSVREAILSGYGVSLLPDQYCKRHIQQGTLVKVFDHIEFESSASTLSVVYPSRRLVPNKTRAFIDFLVGLCEKI